MGRAFEAIRKRDLDRLFRYFGIEVEPELVEQHRQAIAQRFDAETREIVRLCGGLKERERFTIVREALRLAYDSATHGSAARRLAPAHAPV